MTTTDAPPDTELSGPADRNLVVVDNAVKHFPLPRRLLRRHRDRVHSVDDVSLRIERGEVLGLVGESGSGKSTLARVLLRLVKADAGSIVIDGIDVSRLRGTQERTLRQTAQLVFQDPHAAMDPLMSIGDGLEAVLAQHRRGTPQERRRRVNDALHEVGLDDSYVDRLPADCSGGQLQRVVIARALLLEPKLLVCDEPTSALDASVQATVLNLLVRLHREHRLSMLMISHDLRVVRLISDRVAVMYLGEIVEIADRDALFDGAVHPYTLALLHASAHAPVSDAPDAGTALMHGDPPSPVNPPTGCRFHPRCPLAVGCAVRMPRSPGR